MTGKAPGSLPFDGPRQGDCSLVRRRRGWRGLALVAGLLLTGIAWTRMRPRSCRAEARFQVRAEGSSDGGPWSIEHRAARAFGTRANVVALVDRLRLYPRLRETESEAALAARFSNSLDWKVEGDTVRLGFTDADADAEGAERAVQGLIELFARGRRDAAVGRARAALAVADVGIEALEGVLAERQQSLDEFVRANEATIDEFRCHLGRRPRFVPHRAVVRLPSFRSRRLEARLGQLADVLRSLRDPRSSPTLSRAEREQRVEWLERDLQRARSELEESQCEDAARGDRGSDPSPRVSLRRLNLVEVEAEYDRLIADATAARTRYREALTRRLDLKADLQRAMSSDVEPIRVLERSECFVPP